MITTCTARPMIRIILLSVLVTMSRTAALPNVREYSKSTRRYAIELERPPSRLGTDEGKASKGGKAGKGFRAGTAGALSKGGKGTGKKTASPTALLAAEASGGSRSSGDSDSDFSPVYSPWTVTSNQPHTVSSLSGDDDQDDIKQEQTPTTSENTLPTTPLSPAPSALKDEARSTPSFRSPMLSDSGKKKEMAYDPALGQSSSTLAPSVSTTLPPSPPLPTLVPFDATNPSNPTPTPSSLGGTTPQSMPVPTPQPVDATALSSTQAPSGLGATMPSSVPVPFDATNPSNPAAPFALESSSLTLAPSAPDQTTQLTTMPALAPAVPFDATNPEPWSTQAPVDDSNLSLESSWTPAPSGSGAATAPSAPFTAELPSSNPAPYFLGAPTNLSAPYSTEIPSSGSSPEGKKLVSPPTSTSTPSGVGATVPTTPSSTPPPFYDDSNPSNAVPWSTPVPFHDSSPSNAVPSSNVAPFDDSNPSNAAPWSTPGPSVLGLSTPSSAPLPTPVPFYDANAPNADPSSTPVPFYVSDPSNADQSATAVPFIMGTTTPSTSPVPSSLEGTTTPSSSSIPVPSISISDLGPTTLRPDLGPTSPSTLRPDLGPTSPSTSPPSVLGETPNSRPRPPSRPVGGSSSSSSSSNSTTTTTTFVRVESGTVQQYSCPTIIPETLYAAVVFQSFQVQARICPEEEEEDETTNTRNLTMDVLSDLLSGIIVPQLAERHLDCVYNETQEFVTVLMDTSRTGTLTANDNNDTSSCTLWVFPFQMDFTILVVVDDNNSNNNNVTSRHLLRNGRNSNHLHRQLAVQEEIMNSVIAQIVHDSLVTIFNEITQIPITMEGFKNMAEGVNVAGNSTTPSTTTTTPTEVDGSKETDGLVDSKENDNSNNKGKQRRSFVIPLMVVACLMILIVAIVVMKRRRDDTEKHPHVFLKDVPSSRDDDNNTNNDVQERQREGQVQVVEKTSRAILRDLDSHRGIELEENDGDDDDVDQEVVSADVVTEFKEGDDDDDRYSIAATSGVANTVAIYPKVYILAHNNDMGGCHNEATEVEYEDDVRFASGTLESTYSALSPTGPTFVATTDLKKAMKDLEPPTPTPRLLRDYSHADTIDL